MPDEVVQKVSVVVELQAQVDAGAAKAAAGIDSVGEAVSKSNASARAAVVQDRELEEASITHLQARIAELTAAREVAGVAAQAEIDAEIVAVERSVEAHRAEILALDQKQVKLEQVALLVGATSEAERASIQADTAARLAANAALFDITSAQRVAAGSVTATPVVGGEAAGLVAARQEELAVVGQLNARVVELQATRTAASREERVGIDAEIAGIREVIETRTAELLKIDEKQVRLAASARLATAASAEERAAITAETEARVVQLGVMRDQQLAATQASEAALAGGSLGLSGLAGLAVPLLSVAAFTAAVGAVGELTSKLRESLTAARESQEAQDRLQESLGGLAGRYDEVTTAANDTASRTRFSADQLSQVAERLTERGVPFEQVTKAMKSAADVATALHKPLGEVADQIAQTFGGTVPRDLKHAVSGLQDLSPAALEAGAALDVLETRFGGRALTDALTPSGREAKAIKDLSEAWKDLGRQLLPIEEEYLPKITAAASSAIHALAGLSANNGAGFAAAFANQQLGIVGSVASVLLPKSVSNAVNGLIIAQQASFTAQAKAPADQSAAAKLAADGTAARAQIEQLRNDDRGVVAADGAARLAAVAKQVEEEVRLRKAGIDQLLDAIKASEAAQLKPLDLQLGTLQDQRTHAETAADDNRQIGIDNDPLHGKNQAAQDVANVAEAAERQKVKDLDEQILTLRKKIADVTGQSADEQAKAMLDVGRRAVEDTTAAEQRLRDVRSAAEREWEAGAISQQEEQGKINAGVAAYAAAVALAHRTLLAMIATASDPATKKALGDLDADMTGKAAKEGVTPTGGVPGGGDPSEGTDTQVKPGAFRSQAGADLAGGEQLQQSTFSGISDGLLAVETHAKSASQAIRQFAVDFIKSMLEIANQRLAEGAVAALSGGKAGGGLFGLLGATAAGDPVGGLAKVGIGGAGAAATTGTSGAINGVAGFPAGTPAIAGATSAGSAATTGAAGAGAGASVGLTGAIDGIGHTVEGAVGSVTGAITNVGGSIVGGVGGAIGGLGEGIASVAGAGLQGVEQLIGGVVTTIVTAIGEFAAVAAFDTGGYTGPGHPSDPAGVVHAGEYVLNADATRHYGLGILDRMNGDRRRVVRADCWSPTVCCPVGGGDAGRGGGRVGNCHRRAVCPIQRSVGRCRDVGGAGGKLGCAGGTGCGRPDPGGSNAPRSGARGDQGGPDRQQRSPLPRAVGEVQPTAAVTAGG